MNKKKQLSFNLTIGNVSKTHPLFSECEIQVAYAGLNRNASYIDKATIEDALPSANLCPIVGEISAKINDFLGHGGMLKYLEDGGYEIINTTSAYGVIDFTQGVRWEVIDGKEYFILSGLLWTDRFPELNDLLSKSKGQSMEIEILDYDWVQLNGEEVFQIKKFIFSGFCILGDGVEPCFENANIKMFTKQTVQEDFEKMKKELNHSAFSKEDKILDFEKEYKEMKEKYDAQVEANGNLTTELTDLKEKFAKLENDNKELEPYKEKFEQQEAEKKLEEQKAVYEAKFKEVNVVNGMEQYQSEEVQKLIKDTLSTDPVVVNDAKYQLSEKVCELLKSGKFSKNDGFLNHGNDQQHGKFRNLDNDGDKSIVDQAFKK